MENVQCKDELLGAVVADVRLHALCLLMVSESPFLEILQTCQRQAGTALDVADVMAGVTHEHGRKRGGEWLRAMSQTLDVMPKEWVRSEFLPGFVLGIFESLVVLDKLSPGVSNAEFTITGACVTLEGWKEKSSGGTPLAHVPADKRWQSRLSVAVKAWASGGALEFHRAARELQVATVLQGTRFVMRPVGRRGSAVALSDLGELVLDHLLYAKFGWLTQEERFDLLVPKV